MKREDIAKIFEGATDEQISAVLDINSADIGKAKGKLESERDVYKSQLETAKQKLDGFKDVNVEELKGQIATLTTNLADQKAAFDKQLADRDFDDLINGAVTDSKARNVKAVRALLDIDALRESKNQSADLEAALKKLREENDYLFLSDEPFDSQRAVGDTGNPPAAKSIADLDKMTYAEYKAYRQKN